MVDERKMKNVNLVRKFNLFCADLIEKPVIWFRENVVLPNRKEYYWYHEKIRRVPTIDECYQDDRACRFEAEEQFKLDKMVDEYIVKILKKRYEDCRLNNLYDTDVCNPLYESYEHGVNNFFIKYGDLGVRCTAFRCLMKQKNRMAWERRHGPVGTGRKNTQKDVNKNEMLNAGNEC